MATISKKYLDLEGLQKLKDKKAIVIHPTNDAADPAARKVGTDANGHVVLGSQISYTELNDLPTIGNGQLTIQVNGKAINPTGGTFTANKTDSSTYNITAADLGLASGMRFVGISTTDPKETLGATISGYSDWRAGDVILYKRSGESNYEEYILTTGSNTAENWELLGDADSYALKSVTITGDDTYITGGGTLETNRKLSHKTYTAADATAIKVGRDAGGHVVFGSKLDTKEDGTHSHGVTVTTSKEVATGVTSKTKKLNVSTGTDTFVKSYPGATSNLVTASIWAVQSETATASLATAGTAKNYGTADVGETKTVATKASSATTVGNANVGELISITGVQSETITASKAKAGTKVDVAKVGAAVTYGTADCDTPVTGIAKVGSQITYGNANVGTAVTVATGLSGTAYSATYSADDECLSLSALTVNTQSITPAATSSSKAYACAESNGKGISVNIIPAKASTKTLTPAASNGTITPYTFDDVDVPVKASSSTTFNPATSSTTKIYGVDDTVDVTSAKPAPSTQTFTPYTFSDVVVPIKAKNATTVATGSLSTTASGSPVLIGLGEAVTESALKSASLYIDDTTGLAVVTEVSATTEAVTSKGTADNAGSHKHDVI